MSAIFSFRIINKLNFEVLKFRFQVIFFLHWMKIILLTQLQTSYKLKKILNLFCIIKNLLKNLFY